MNAARAKVEDAKVMDEPQGKTWQCPRCGNPLDLVAEHAFLELWECAQCGYSKKVKQ
jgi:ribosomal protein S27AE